MASSKIQNNNFVAHAVTGGTDDSFVGIKIKNSQIDFYYPESYDLSNKNDIVNYRKDILAIINTISIAKTFSKESGKIETSLSDSSSFVLYSYLWTIKDFLINGIYINREKTLKANGNGKINWKRTLQGEPIISNGNIIYNNIIVEVPNNSDNIIVDIHKYCIKKSIEYIGWLFGLSPSIISVKPFNESIKRIYISVLKKELYNTFDDYKKLRLNHMLKIIQGIDDSDVGDEFIYGVDSYYYIFERMVDSIFGNVDNTKRFNPKSDWYLLNNENKYNKYQSSELRPDTILTSNNGDTVYVIDSKFYRYGTTSNPDDLPESTSIQKQITYGEYIKQINNSIDNIRNVFILPYNKSNNKLEYTKDLQYIGYAQARWKNNTEDHQTIYAFLIDLKHVVQTWNIKSFHNKDIFSLIEDIENEIKK